MIWFSWTVQAASQITLMNIWTCAKYNIWIKCEATSWAKITKKHGGIEGMGRSKASLDVKEEHEEVVPQAPHWRRAGGRPAPSSSLALLIPSSAGRPRTSWSWSWRLTVHIWKKVREVREIGSSNKQFFLQVETSFLPSLPHRFKYKGRHPDSMLTTTCLLTTEAKPRHRTCNQDNTVSFSGQL